MTVRELIRELTAYPLDAHVCIEAEYDMGYGLAGGKIDDIWQTKCFDNGDCCYTMKDSEITENTDLDHVYDAVVLRSYE